MSAAVAMPALSDDEDGPPNLPPRLRIMPNDEITDTLAPETDPDAPTGVENPIPRREAMNPPPRPTSDSLLIDCMNQLLEGNESLKRIRHDLLDPEGAFSERQREHRRVLVIELKEAIIPRVTRLEDAVAEFRKQIDSLQSKMENQRVEYEEKFAEQQKCLDAINELMPELERALANARAPEPTAPTEP